MALPCGITDHGQLLFSRILDTVERFNGPMIGGIYFAGYFRKRHSFTINYMGEFMGLWGARRISKALASMRERSLRHIRVRVAYSRGE